MSEDKLDTIMQMLVGIQAQLTVLTTARAAPAAPARERTTRSRPDEDPDDPIVWIDPRRWEGQSMKGRKLSDCPHAFLREYSDALEAFARKARLDGRDAIARKHEATAAIASRLALRDLDEADQIAGGDPDAAADALAVDDDDIAF